MSSATPKPYPVPSHTVCWKMRELIRDGKEAEALALLEDFPGLADADLRWNQREYTGEAFIVLAAEAEMAGLFKKLLEKGSDPFAPIGDSKQLFFDLLRNTAPIAQTHRPFTEHTAVMLEASLASPHFTDKTHHRYVSASIRPPLHGMMHKDVNDELADRRRAIFAHIVQLLGLEELHPNLSWFTSEVTMHGSARDLSFIVRTLVNHGFDLEQAHAEQEIRFPPHWHDYAAALIAAGFGEDRIIDIFKGDLPSVREKYTPYFASTTWAGISADKLLRDEMLRVYQKSLPVRELLMTDDGHPTWQAQGLAARGLIGELLDEKRAQHFGGREAQRDFAMTLHNALHERFRGNLNIAGMLREEKLAQPEDAVTVRYMRGADVTTGKGAA